MIEAICVFASKASLAMLLMNGLMLAIVKKGSAEQLVTILSIILMLILFVTSTAILRVRRKKNDQRIDSQK